MSGNDDFFGASTPPASTPSPGYPAPPLRPGYAAQQFGGMGSQPLPSKSSSPVLPLVVGLLVAAMVGALAFAGYRVLFGGSHIEMPDTLMGLERVEPDATTQQLLDSSTQQLKSEIGDANIEVALYQSPSQVIFVLGGDVGSDDISDAKDFFTGMEGGLASAGQAGTMKSVDPGPHGGDMRCLQVQSNGTCAWIDEDTFGAFVIAPLSGDLDAAAVELRESVEK
jgi:hypothetical protein